MRGKKTMAVALLLATCGCGERVERDETVSLDQVPAEVLRAANKALPGVKFERAQKAKVNGKEVYEVRGKEKGGKIREVEVSAAGEVVEIE